MASWRDAVQPVAGGTRILVEAHPGARSEAFPDGFNEWRDGRIGIRVRAQPQEGDANRAVVAAVAAFFEVAASVVVLEHGATDRRKSVVVPLPRERVLSKLAEVLP